MNVALKTSLGILVVSAVLCAYADQLDVKLNQQCQILRCNPTTEICYVNPDCPQDDLEKCVSCLLKTNATFAQPPPVAPRLLATSNQSQVVIDDFDSKSNTTDVSSYDEYYEYDEDETSDKNDADDDDEYLDDYVESLDDLADRSPPVRKLGTCAKVVEAIGNCDTEKLIPPECRFDTDCPGDLKCCEVACGRRMCNIPLKPTVSVCPATFECSLNCRLGYRTDANGCLQCECQSCPTMDQCNKNCPSGYLKDLFGCDTCECSDRCAPFTCNILCPPELGFAQSDTGCPLCQCAISKSSSNATTSSCQEDVHCPPGFRCLNDARNVPMCQAVPTFNIECANDLAKTCSLQCPNGNYLLDDKGCPTCACVSTKEQPPISCPQIKCRANCGNAGYQVDENGCQMCKCVSKADVQCSRVMCRMFCKNGFKRDENGCEFCACNEEPTACPELTCARQCANGFRKDYSGCPTCDCDCPSMMCPAAVKNCANLKKDANGCSTCTCDDQQDKPVIDECPKLDCALTCDHGMQRDESGCPQCACNRCPLQLCRMFCPYGFRRNDQDCQVCECDWSPVVEKIECSERIPCEGNRVCNLEMKLCEKVDPDKVGWFVFDFEVQSDLFQDARFVQAFKNGFISNVATRYDLSITQISVSSVEENGLTSFHVLPFFSENMVDFQRKLEQIDIDLNSYEFRSLLPAVAQAIEIGEPQARPRPRPHTTIDRIGDQLRKFTRKSTRFAIALLVVLMIATAFVIGFVYIHACRRRLTRRSGSKMPIFDASYQQASTEDDHYHAVHAPDGTAYVVVETDDAHSSTDKRTLV